MPFKLYYFNLKGRAEIIRLIFAEAEEEYEDVRIEFADWPGSTKDTMPFGAMPVLEEDGQKLAQTSAIVRSLAKKFGIDGENDKEKATIDSYYEMLTDIKGPFMQNVAFEGDAGKKKEALKKWAEETWPKNMKHFEKILEDNAAKKQEFLVGKKISYVDLAFMDMMGAFKDLLSEDEYKTLDVFKRANEHMERIAKRPKIEKWLKSQEK